MISFITILVRFVRAIAGSWKDPKFRGLFSLVVTLASGTLFYWQVEGWGPLDALYFSVVTLTPTTAAGKVFTILYVFVGIGVILGFVNAVAERSLERRKERTQTRC